MAIELDHPTWMTAAATGIGYLLCLVVAFVILFVVPWFLFTTL